MVMVSVVEPFIDPSNLRKVEICEVYELVTYFLI